MINLNLDADAFDEAIEKKPSTKSDAKYNALEFEYFKVISDWYHYAIIELTLIDGFSSSPMWISERLGITTNQAKSAIERLISLGLLQKKDNMLSPSSKGNTKGSNKSADDISDFDPSIASCSLALFSSFSDEVYWLSP